jgi:hypothetical protein
MSGRGDASPRSAFIAAVRAEMTAQRYSIGKRALFREALLATVLAEYGESQDGEPRKPKRTPERETWLRANYPSTLLDRTGVLREVNALDGAAMTQAELNNWLFALGVKKDSETLRALGQRAGLRSAEARTSA